MRLAAIDVGTNSVRLLVGEVAGDGYRDLDRRLLITRLGQGVDAGGRIGPEAMKRTLAAVAEFCSVCGEFGVHRVRIAGTSAVRDAANSEEFLAAAAKLSGGPAVALSGEEEARLSFLGATGNVAGAPCLVCDVGGGSTELVAGGPGPQISGRISLDMGSVRLTERFCRSDPWATEEILTMEAAVDELLAAAAGIEPGDGRLIGLGGTITTLAAIHLGQRAYDPQAVDQLRLRIESVKALYRNLSAMTVAQRREIPVLPEGRADVIVAGCSILVRTMSRFGFQSLIVSEKDILDGLLVEMVAGLA